MGSQKLVFRREAEVMLINIMFPEMGKDHKIYDF